VAELPIPFDPPENATQDELKGRLRAIAALLERAPVPIAVAHDAECRFITANAALSRLLGVTHGRNISLTPPPGEEPAYRIQRNGVDIPADELPMQFAIANRAHVTNDIEILRTDGLRRHYFSRPLVSGSYRDPYSGLRRGQPGALVRRQLRRLRSRPQTAPGRRSGAAAPDQIQKISLNKPA
jgi:PAS domain-containing protein